MSQLPVDLDSESIQYDGKWYTRDELARRIKGMLDAGDFSISRPSAAIEQLTATLASLRTVAFRATPELADALTREAQRLGRSPGQLIREALEGRLGLSPARGEPAAASPRALTPPPQPAASAPAEAAAEEADIPTPRPVLAGPGALKQAAGVVNASPTVLVDGAVVTESVSSAEAGAPVELTTKKREDEEAVERRWFGG